MWDSVSYQYEGYVDFPLNATQWAYYGTEVATMAADPDYFVDPADLKEGDFQAWADEGYQYSIDNVYPGFGVNELPSQEYRDQAEKLTRLRVMQGGARLSALMANIFKPNAAFLQ